MIQPKSNHVVVRMARRSARTDGGITIPDPLQEVWVRGLHRHNDGFARATVVAVGPGSRARKNGALVPVGVSVGDVVAFEPSSGIELDSDGEQLLVIDGDHIFGVVEPEDAA